MGPRILIVDDDRDYLELSINRLNACGFKAVDALDDSRQAAELFESNVTYDVAVIDIGMPEMDGQALLEIIKKTSPATECIMVTAMNDARTAVNCLRKGAYDYLVKPVSEDEVIFAVKRALERKRLLDILHVEKSRQPPAFSHPAAFQPILTRSKGLLRVLKEAELHAGSDVPILVTGESGTGKELLARAIHAASPRAEQPFLPVNMAALANELFDAEFFGHTKGAFTGAEKERAGHLKHCNHGTLFLDEIGNLRPPVKADDPGVAERIAKRLVHLTKYFNVQALTAPESEEGQLLRVELLPPSAEGKESGPPVYPPETKVTLKVTNALTPNPDDINDPTRILNITILNLQADWGITQIFPKGAGASEILQPGRSKEMKLKTYLPEGYSETRDVLKVFATQKTTSFRWLELPVLDQAPKAKGGTRGIIADPLEKLISAFTSDEAPSRQDMTTRSVEVISDSSAAKTWAVAQVEMHVKKAD